jgi:hypothetical protein
MKMSSVNIEKALLSRRVFSWDSRGAKMKRLFITILFVLLTTQLAFCDTASFQIGATIPRIIGVNYFPKSGNNESTGKKDVTEKIVLRNGQRIRLQTSVIK